MSDILLVAWLRWRQFLASAIYWLRVIGYERDKPSLMNRLYVLYFIVFAIGWVFLMWLFAQQQAYTVGALVPAETRDGILMALPWVVLAGQAFLMYRALRSSPLKLSFPDTAYMAGSPLGRHAPLVVDLLKTVLIWLLPIVPIAALLAIVIDVPLGTALTLSGAPAALVAVPLIALTWAIAWTLGAARIAGVPILRSPVASLLPILWLVGGYFLPTVFLWPGQTLVEGMLGQIPVAGILALAVLSVVMVVAMARVGQRANMIQVTDESVVYARLSQLGLLRWTQPGLAGHIKSEVAIASRGAWFTLPRGFGAWSAAGRAALAFIRHPLNLVKAVVVGGSLTYSGAWVLVTNAPAQLWLLWIFAIVVASPAAIVKEYRSDLKEPYLRQFLPVSNLRLLMADTALPLAIIIVGLVALGFVPGVAPGSTISYIVMVVLVVVLETLCLGLDAIRLPGLGIRISSMWSSIFSFGLILVLNTFTGDLFLPLTTGVVIALFLALMLSTSYETTT